MSVLCLYVLMSMILSETGKEVLKVSYMSVLSINVLMSMISSERGKRHPESVLCVCALSICFHVYDGE